MLAEIFLVQIETQLREAARNARPTSSEGRFVPFTLPRESVPGAGLVFEGQSLGLCRIGRTDRRSS